MLKFVTVKITAFKMHHMSHISTKRFVEFSEVIKCVNVTLTEKDNLISLQHVLGCIIVRNITRRVPCPSICVTTYPTLQSFPSIQPVHAKTQVLYREKANTQHFHLLCAITHCFLSLHFKDMSCCFCMFNLLILYQLKKR